MTLIVGKLNSLPPLGSLTEAFTPRLVVDRDAIQTVPNSSGAVTVALSPAGGHKAGASKILVFPVGSATSVVFGTDLNAHGDAFDAAKVYIAVVTYAGGVFDTVTRALTARDVAAPTIVSAKVSIDNKDGLVLVFSEPMYLADLTGLSLNFSVGTARTLTAIESGNGTTTITLTLSGNLSAGDALGLVIASGRTLQDLNGNLIATGTTTISNEVDGPIFADTIHWERADAVTMNGGAIAQFTDKSGNANHHVQATGSKQATLLATGGPNSTPAGDFDGTDDGYTVTALKVATADPADYTEYTMIAVAKFDGTAADQCIADTADVTAATETGPRFLLVSGGQGIWFTCPLNSGNAVIAVPDTNWHWYMGIHRGATREIYKDGVLANTDSNANNPAAQRGATIGYARAGNVPIDGKIAEVILVGRALSAGEIAMLKSYISARYALAVS